MLQDFRERYLEIRLLTQQTSLGFPDLDGALVRSAKVVLHLGLRRPYRLEFVERPGNSEPAGGECDRLHK
jgi:hypothetical protein